VSGAHVNAAETLSTLRYANRARNIRNKPVKNTDTAKEELRCLRQTAHFLKVIPRLPAISCQFRPEYGFAVPVRALAAEVRARRH
jgi:hypothetical protein